MYNSGSYYNLRQSHNPRILLVPSARAVVAKAGKLRDSIAPHVEMILVFFSLSRIPRQLTDESFLLSFFLCVGGGSRRH